MALKKRFEDNYGGDNLEGYHKIGEFFIDTIKDKKCRIVVCLYINQAARDNGKDYIDMREFLVEGEAYEQFFGNEIFEVDNTNHVKQAYIYLKTLPDYEGAIDV